MSDIQWLSILQKFIRSYKKYKFTLTSGVAGGPACHAQQD
jgi:hypothetical protein